MQASSEIELPSYFAFVHGADSVEDICQAMDIGVLSQGPPISSARNRMAFIGAAQ
jgi:hypothetical protein